MKLMEPALLLTFEIHPGAKQFPKMLGADYEEFRDDIRRNGVVSPILVRSNVILDGRNRLSACEELGIPVPVEEYHGVDEIGEIISRNILRRHLTDEQRVALVAKVRSEEIVHGAEARMRSGRQTPTGHHTGRAAQLLAQEAKASDYKARAAIALMKTEPGLIDEVIEGKKRLVEAAAVARGGRRRRSLRDYPPEEQVQRRFLRFMSGFPVTEHRQVRAILHELV